MCMHMGQDVQTGSSFPVVHAGYFANQHTLICAYILQTLEQIAVDNEQVTVLGNSTPWAAFPQLVINT